MRQHLRVVCSVLLSVALASAAPPPARAIEVNGQLQPTAVPPESQSGQTFVPLGDVGRACGAVVQWVAATRTVTLTKGETTLELQVGSTKATVNGKPVTLDFKPYTRQSAKTAAAYTMVPLRFIAEQLGASVGFNPATNRVLISTKPRNWPDHLADFQPPAGMTWASFRVAPKDDMPQALVPAGGFLMGSPATEPGRLPWEGPQQQVTVAAFWIDLHEVTVAQYRRFAVATSRPLSDTWQQFNTADRQPVSSVSWGDAEAYATWAGRALPTEAQWEHAARGGTSTAYAWGDQWDEAKANGSGQVQPVASHPANQFGLYDLSGSLWEWCRDWYDHGWYRRLPSVDPVNLTPGTQRSLRGGGFYGPPDLRRVASRMGVNPDQTGSLLGFRCVSAVP